MSGLNDQDARALTYLARRLRDETHGCRQWDEAGVFAKLAELKGQNLALTIERVLCHATDPEAKTPGSINRPFLPPKPSERPKDRAHPPRKAEECRSHPGHYATNCGGCRADKLAMPDENEPDDETQMTKDEALAAMRAALTGGHA